MKGVATGGGTAPWGALAAVRRALAWLRQEARRHLGLLRQRLTAAHIVLRARWLRSLQLRVVTTTLVISALVVTVLGFFLMQQITWDQLKAEERQSGNVVESGLISVQAEAAVDARPSASSPDLMDTIVRSLEPPPNAQSSYGVAIMLAPGYSGPPVYEAGQYAGVVTSEIPHKLTTKVAELQKKGKSTASFTFASMTPPTSTDTKVLEPGLVYGAPVSNYYELYYFFPLNQVEQSLAQYQRTLLVAGIALASLFTAIAALITRWVVTPVRHAARGAQRLSTGNLDERMPVRGVDELAALATSFNEMAESLQEKMRALEALSQVQRQFVSDVSHELRTPLTTIKLAADVLFSSRDRLEGDAARSAEVLESQLDRFESLLTDLLEISRYDANVAVLDPEPVDICDLARQSADVAQQLAERRGAKIEFRLPAEPCIAEVDRVRVERILRNLLVNAVEHGEGKDAVVTVAEDSGAVAVAVRDYGIGLAPGQERLVFDRFWRADPARARTTGGTGLGLAIALEDTRLHGGWLEACGELGRGSVFRLTLPRTAGGELAGSPLPLAPDDAELPDAPAAGTLAAAHGVTPSLAAVLPGVLAVTGPTANGSVASGAAANGDAARGSMAGGASANGSVANGSAAAGTAGPDVFAGSDAAAGSGVADPDLAATVTASARAAGPAARGYDRR
jgi:two-component system, OmpR family, sensor histidine kinase MtrB